MATALSYAKRFWQKWGVIKNFKYRCELKDFQKCWLSCVWYLFKLKTDYENLLHVYLYIPVFAWGLGLQTIENVKVYFLWIEMVHRQVLISCILESFSFNTESQHLKGQSSEIFIPFFDIHE